MSPILRIHASIIPNIYRMNSNFSLVALNYLGTYCIRFLHATLSIVHQVNAKLSTRNVAYKTQLIILNTL